MVETDTAEANLNTLTLNDDIAPLNSGAFLWPKVLAYPCLSTAKSNRICTPSVIIIKDIQRMDAFLITLAAGGVVLWLFENNNGENE